MYIDTNKTNLKFNFKYALPRLTEDKMAEVDEIWEKAIIENPLLFNGKHFSVTDFNKINNQVEIDVGVTEYKYRIWAKSQNSIPSGVRPITLVVFIYDNKTDMFYMVKRSQKVAAYKGEINGIGGNVDYDESAVDDIESHLKRIALKELSEEIILDREINIDDIKNIGFVYIPDISYLCFNFICIGKIEGINDNDELVEIIPIKRSEYKEFVINNVNAKMPWLEDDLYNLVDRLVDINLK